MDERAERETRTGIAPADAHANDKEQAPIPLDGEALFQAYADMLYRLCLVRTRSRSDAEDAVQETFLRVLRSKPTFQNREHQKAWLLTVAINCSKNLMGSAFRRHQASDELMDTIPAPEGSDGSVRDAVMALPEKYRTVVHLFYYEGYSVAEMSHILSAPESTVKSWLFRARAALRDSLKGGFDDV